MLEKQSFNFIRIGGCNSCHAQDLPSLAAALARERGLRAKTHPAGAAACAAPYGGTADGYAGLGFTSTVTGVAWDLFDWA